jgi:hypothetical protein
MKSPIINLFHIFIVAPFLYYIATQKGNANPMAFTVLLYIVYSVVVFHSYLAYSKFFTQTQKEKCIDTQCKC